MENKTPNAQPEAIPGIEDSTEAVAKQCNTRVQPLLEENARLRERILADAEIIRCIESWKREELIWIDSNRDLKHQIDALKKEIEDAPVLYSYEGICGTDYSHYRQDWHTHTCRAVRVTKLENKP